MWGFFEGWWSWLYLLADLAIYPVLFVEYASFFFPSLTGHGYIICLTVIWCCAGLNILGILPVGRASAAFVAAVTIGTVNAASPPAANTVHHTAPALAVALFTVMWNYLGWDNPMTFAAEVDRPVRSYLVSTIAAFALIAALYAITIFAAASSGIDAAQLEKEGFPSLGLRAGGAPLGDMLSTGGMASAIGLFVAGLLSLSRLPTAMSHDGFLPRVLRNIDSRHGTPAVSILVCASIVSLMVLWRFEDLIIIDVMLYGSALLLEFLALIALRKRAPAVSRPFRIPLGTRGLIVLTILPAACFLTGAAGLASSRSIHTLALVFALALLATAPFAWLKARRALLERRPDDLHQTSTFG
jgi:amino acid transporter